jgi:hypothetical protein
LQLVEGTRLLSLTKTATSFVNAAQAEAAGPVKVEHSHSSSPAKDLGKRPEEAICLQEASDKARIEPISAFRPGLGQILSMQELAQHCKPAEAIEHAIPLQGLAPCEGSCGVSVAEQRLVARRKAQVALASFPLDGKVGE